MFNNRVDHAVWYDISTTIYWCLYLIITLILIVKAWLIRTSKKSSGQNIFEYVLWNTTTFQWKHEISCYYSNYEWCSCINKECLTFSYLHNIRTFRFTLFGIEIFHHSYLIFKGIFCIIHDIENHVSAFVIILWNVLNKYRVL